MRQVSLHPRQRIDKGICPEISRCDDDGRFRIAENIFGLALSQSRVDRDDDSANTNRAMVSDQPLGAIRAPDRHVISGIDPERHKRSRNRIGRLVELRVAVSSSLKNADDRVAIREARSSIAQCSANGKIEKWLIRDARRVGERKAGHLCFCLMRKLRWCRAQVKSFAEDIYPARRLPDRKQPPIWRHERFQRRPWPRLSPAQSRA